MKRDRNYLIETYNATSIGNEHDELETYETWLERQLLSRLDKIDELELSQTETEEIEFYIATERKVHLHILFRSYAKLRLEEVREEIKKELYGIEGSLHQRTYNLAINDSLSLIDKTIKELDQ